MSTLTNTYMHDDDVVHLNKPTTQCTKRNSQNVPLVEIWIPLLLASINRDKRNKTRKQMIEMMTNPDLPNHCATIVVTLELIRSPRVDP